MVYDVIECSPKAKTKVITEVDAIGVDLNAPMDGRTKYPFQRLFIGQSFAVPFGEANEASIRNGASNYAKKSGKKFAVIRHNEYSCFEVARIR